MVPVLDSCKRVIIHSGSEFVPLHYQSVTPRLKFGFYFSTCLAEFSIFIEAVIRWCQHYPTLRENSSQCYLVFWGDISIHLGWFLFKHFIGYVTLSLYTIWIKYNNFYSVWWALHIFIFSFLHIFFSPYFQQTSYSQLKCSLASSSSWVSVPSVTMICYWPIELDVSGQKLSVAVIYQSSPTRFIIICAPSFMERAYFSVQTHRCSYVLMAPLEEWGRRCHVKGTDAGSQAKGKQ